VIRPDGFEISKDSMEIHHISTEQAHIEGTDIRYVLRDLFKDIKNYKVQEIVAHNVTFDLAVLKKELLKIKEEPYLSYLGLIR
jgi:DNA polymerase III epsilon subunit-like protein